MNEPRVPERLEKAPKAPLSAPRRRPVILLLCCALLVVALAVTACVFLLSKKKTTPLEKTLQALVQDEGMPADQVNTDAGRFVLTLGKDVLGKTAKEPLTVRGSTVYSGRKTGVELRFGTAEQTVGGQALFSKDALYLASPELFGQTVYSIPLDDETLLRKSGLNPENGGEYALSQETFDALCRAAKLLEAMRADGAQKESVSAILGRLKTVLRENLKIEKAAKTVDLIDVSCECEVVSYTLDSDGMTALLRALKEELDQAHPIEQLNALSPVGSVITETDKSLSDTLDRILKSKAQLSLSFSYALLDGYLVRADARFEMLGYPNADDRLELTARVRFTSDPAARREAEATFTYRENGRNVLALSLAYANTGIGETGRRLQLSACLDVTESGSVYTRYRVTGRLERDDSGALTADAGLKTGTFDGRQEKLRTRASVHLAGAAEWKQSEKLLTAEITSLAATVTAEDGTEETVLDLTESSLLLELGGKSEKLRLKRATNLLKATPEDLQQYHSAAREQLDTLMSRISEESGALQRTKRFTVAAELPLEESYQNRVAWDRSTNRVYVIHRESFDEWVLTGYDGRNGKQLCTRTFQNTILSVDADAGFVAYTLQESPPKVHIADGASLNDTADIIPSLPRQSEATGLHNVAIDGSHLFFTTKETYSYVYYADWSADRCENINAGIPDALTAYDRANHVYAVMNGSGSQSLVRMFRAGTGECRTAKVSESRPTTVVYFNGTTFQACGTCFSASGVKVKKLTLTPNRPYTRDVEDYGILYADRELYLLQYRHRNNTWSTPAYCTSGAPVTLPSGWLFTHCYGRQGDTLAVIGMNTAPGAETPYSVLMLRARDTWTLQTR